MEQQLNNLLAAVTGGGAQGGGQLSPLPFLFLMAVSLLSSLFISYLYLFFYSSRATGSQVHRAFPLLGTSITAIFICIQFSLPLSLGLLGALSIVRFRTPIKEPEEIGFIMLVIAVSIATATFKLEFVGIIFLIAVTGLLIQAWLRVLRSSTSDGTIVVSVPSGDGADHAAVTEVLKRRLKKTRLESISQAGHETVISYNFRSAGEDALLALPGELRAASAGATFNVFFNRPGAL